MNLSMTARLLALIAGASAQLVQLIRVKTMFEQTENPEFPKLDLSQAVDHVVRFSAAGIRAYAMGAGE